MQEVLWRICGAKNGLVSDFCGFLSFAELCLAKNKQLHKSLIKSHFRDKMAEGVGFGEESACFKGQITLFYRVIKRYSPILTNCQHILGRDTFRDTKEHYLPP